MASGNAGLIQQYMFEPETGSKEVKEWIILGRLQVNEKYQKSNAFYVSLSTTSDP